jgi:hypothetical protein
MDPTIPTFAQLLGYLATPEGSWFAITFAVSWGLEKFGAWAAWDNPTAKKYIMLALAAGLAFGIQTLAANPELMAAIEPVYTWLATFVGGWLTLEVVHRVGKKLTE